MIRLGIGFVILICSYAQVVPPSGGTASCRQFAQTFYDWYVPLSRKESNGPSSDLAIRRKGDIFAPDLLRALKLDSAAQARAKGELIGLDFDPFVGSQDPGNRYEVRAVKLQGNKCSAEVWDASAPAATSQPRNPDVVAEIEQRAGGHWQFTNFRYPELKTDLSAVLSQLRAERQRNIRKPK